MDRSRFRKKKENSKQAWLDWLADEGPSTDAKAELRERYKRQANAYRPRTLQPSPVALPEPEHKPEAKAPSPASVSIQINIPALDTHRLRKLRDMVREKATALYRQLTELVAANKRRSIVIASVAVFVLLGVFVPPLLHHGKDVAKSSGSATATSAGGNTGYDKPPFEVVVPSSKPKLATPDGTHSAYDGHRNTFSFGDSISGNGFIVSQQPIPPKFNGGQEAVSKIGPSLGDPSPHQVTTLFGKAYIATNPKTAAQSLVFSIRDLLLFIQSAHRFTDAEWTTYINALQ